MKRFLVVLLFVLVIPLSLSTLETISVCVRDWKMLRAELSISKNHLANINEEVRNLKESLEKAKLEQQNLQVSLIVSKEKIVDLERHLALAVQQRDQLQNIVNSLENQSIELLQSLNNTQKILNENEEKHIKNINKLATKYERRLLIKNIFIVGLTAVIVVETVLLVIKSMVN